MKHENLIWEKKEKERKSITIRMEKDMFSPLSLFKSQTMEQVIKHRKIVKNRFDWWPLRCQ